MKPNRCYRTSNSKYICEFGWSADYRFLRLWKRHSSGVPDDHILNHPEFDKLLLDMTSWEGFSRRAMIKAAERYGFTETDFNKTIKQNGRRS